MGPEGVEPTPCRLKGGYAAITPRPPKGLGRIGFNGYRRTMILAPKEKGRASRDARPVRRHLHRKGSRYNRKGHALSDAGWPAPRFSAIRLEFKCDLQLVIIASTAR
jgi:hypothetical protein